MPSCSRIALRCGDVDASSSGAASAMFTRDPELLRGPLLRPLRAHVRVVRVCLGVRRREQLDQPLELEVVRTEEVEHLAVGKVELDLAGVLPFDAMQAALRTLQLL